MWWFTMKTEQEVDSRGSLYYLINAFIGAYNRRTDMESKALQAIALALSTPQDNSAEVKAQIAKLEASRQQLDAALNNQPKGE